MVPPVYAFHAIELHNMPQKRHHLSIYSSNFGMFALVAGAAASTRKSVPKVIDGYLNIKWSLLMDTQ